MLWMRRSRLVPLAATGLLWLSGVMSNAHAAWVPQGTPVSAPGAPAVPKGIVADDLGGCYVVWQRGTTSPVGESVRLDANGSLMPGWAPGQHALAGRLLGAGSDAAGGLLVGWFDGTETRSQRFRPSGAIMTGWPAAGVPMRTSYYLPPEGVEEPLVWLTTPGGVCWSGIRFVNFSNSSVWVTAVTPSGTIPPAIPYCPPMIAAEPFTGVGEAFGMWPQYDGILTYGRGAGELVTRDPAMSSWHHAACWSFYRNQPWYVVERLVNDGGDGVLALASALTPGSQRRIQHWGPTGSRSPGWTEDGLPFATPEPAFDPGSPPVSAADGNGGLFVGWTQPGSTGTQVRVAHRLGSGLADPVWPPDGVLVCEASGARRQVVLESDGAGGVLAMWIDQRADTLGDLYAAHLYADGVLDGDYAIGGQPVCTVPGVQAEPRATVLVDGSFVVMWRDERTLQPAVFAQRLPVPAFVSVPGAGLDLRFRVQIQPNPSRGACQVRFSLAEREDVRIEVLDVAGRRLHEESHAALSAGPQQFELRLPTHGAGLRWVRVTAGQKQATVPAVRME